MIYAVICVSVALLVYAIVTLVQYHLLTVRLKKRVKREIQRNADKLEAKRRYRGT